VVTKTAGAHNVKMGSAFIVRDAQKRGVGGSPSGNYTFDAALTSSGPQGSGGNAVASMLLGYPSAATRNFEQVIPNYHSLEPSVFAQDDWHARSWLTVNYGVRYDVEFTPTFKAINGTAEFGQNFLGVTQGIPRDNNNFAPRIGLAWDPWSDHKTAIRASYGIFYDHPLLALAFDSDVADGSSYASDVSASRLLVLADQLDRAAHLELTGSLG